MHRILCVFALFCFATLGRRVQFSGLTENALAPSSGASFEKKISRLNLLRKVFLAIEPGGTRHHSATFSTGHRHGRPKMNFWEDVDEDKEARRALSLQQRNQIKKQAEEQYHLMQANTREMQLPTASAAKMKSLRKKGRVSGGGGGGFGQKASTSALSASEERQATVEHKLQVESIKEDGVCLIPGVLAKELAAALYDCLADELRRAYDAVESTPECCVERFNVPAWNFDPLRGYMLLPLRDETSVEEGNPNGAIVRALRALLAPGAPLGELFSAFCGGGQAEFYDVVALRTEAGAARQIVHSDTPAKESLFCAFIAVHDVSYEMGSTVFLPGTHKESAERSDFDAMRVDPVLSKTPSRYSMLKAGDAVFFNMHTLHAGTANFLEEEGGRQRLLFIVTFRHRKKLEELGHAPNLRPGYRNRDITLKDLRSELQGKTPFAGIHKGDGNKFGDGLTFRQSAHLGS